MVDRSKRGKIIDFGSVAPFSTSNRFKLDDYTRMISFIKFDPLPAITVLTKICAKNTQQYIDSILKMNTTGILILTCIVWEGSFLMNFICK